MAQSLSVLITLLVLITCGDKVPSTSTLERCPGLPSHFLRLRSGMISISTVRWLHRHPDDVSQSSLCKVAGIPTLVVFRRETGEIVTKEARGHIDPNDVQAPWSTDCCSMYLLPTVPHANDLLSWPCEGGLGRVGCWRRQLAQGSRACQCSIVGLAIVSKANRRSIHPGANTAFFDLKFIYCWYTGHRAERWGRPDVFRVQRPLRHAGATWNHSLACSP